MFCKNFFYKKNKIWDDLAYYSFILTIGDSTHAKLMDILCYFSILMVHFSLPR